MGFLLLLIGFLLFMAAIAIPGPLGTLGLGLIFLGFIAGIAGLMMIMPIEGKRF